MIGNIICYACYSSFFLCFKAVYITGEEVFSFKMVSYMDATDGGAYVDMNVFDSQVYLTVGCIQVVFVNKFVSSILVSQI